MEKIVKPECDFDDYFDEHTKWRGYDYYKKGRVNNIKVHNNIYTAIVTGTKNYNVSFKYEYGDITDMKCSCPSFEKGNKCKHLYAFVFAKFGKEVTIERPTISEVFNTNEDNDEEIPVKEKNHHHITLLEILQGLFGAAKEIKSEFNENRYDPKEKERQKLEDEMDNYGLTEEEKDLVRSGEYEPWDFEYPEDHENLEEDDYYHDDLL